MNLLGRTTGLWLEPGLFELDCLPLACKDAMAISLIEYNKVETSVLKSYTLFSKTHLQVSH